MPDVSPTPTPDLPSARSLRRSTLLAASVAGVILVTVVLPAEYGVDPTGVGRMLGLTEMGRIKMALEREAAVEDSIAALGDEPTPAAPTHVAAPGAVADPLSSHVTEIVLLPNEGREIKLAMRKGARVTYAWSTDRGVVNFDTHADAPGIDYHGYSKGTGSRSEEGVLTAAFDGNHGWFWRNRGRDTVKVTLTTNGDYQELKRM